MSQTRDIIVELLRNIGGRKEVQQYLRQYCSVDARNFAVLRIGDDVLGDTDELAASLAFLQKVGLYPIVVHGPGRALGEAGFDGGVTDAAALEAARRLGRDACIALVDALESQGVGARPITSGVFEAEAREGLTGAVTAIDTTAVDASLRGGKLPIVVAVGESIGGQILHLDSDEATFALARKLEPSKIIVLERAGGLRDEEDRLVSAVNLSEDYDRLAAAPWVPRGRLSQIRALLEALPATSSLSITAPDHLARELFTHRGAGTLIRRGERVLHAPSFEGLDLDRLRLLLETCFERKLHPSYFDEKDCDRVYFTEDYRATAIITREAEMPYLDKFAVTTKAQGEGLGGSLWARMRSDYQCLFWRARAANAVNRWYFEQADGSYKDGPWTVFWYGMASFEAIRRCVETALALPATLKDHGAEDD
jgi:bifunctional N-acetylglutamate synthase/kinase